MFRKIIGFFSTKEPAKNIIPCEQLKTPTVGRDMFPSIAGYGMYWRENTTDDNRRESNAKKPY